MAYQSPSDLETPEHDPIADEQDLLTVKEAAARLHDQLGTVRAEVAEAESAGGPSGQLDALRHRISTLEIGMQRYDTLRRARNG
jgi:hypothetical protein